ncbi:hypothetical protein F5148DRAFT_1147140 [Russula earlei]|uniref:Uncharacterized protein n=1 Tax=Russula earlei TaxID=71964 RepID=A0ACC0UHP1_9AGAM|nr:hypothetical protein F5148DRAFT_1147140 [Russula earlei]
MSKSVEGVRPDDTRRRGLVSGGGAGTWGSVVASVVEGREVMRGQTGSDRTHDEGDDSNCLEWSFQPYARCGVVVAAAVLRSSVVQEESELATDKPRSKLELLATKRGMMERSRSSYAALSTEVEGVVGGRADYYEGASSMQVAMAAGGVLLVSAASSLLAVWWQRLLLWRRLAGLWSGAFLVSLGDPGSEGRQQRCDAGVTRN